MPELAMNHTSISLPHSLWEQVLEVAKAQGHKANEVIQEALENYLVGQTSKPVLTPEEKEAALLQRLYAARTRRKFAYEKAVAEGKSRPLTNAIPIEQVREALSGIDGSLAAEVIKEREEGW